MILRVPGIGVKSAQQIIASRRFGRLNSYQLKKMGIVMKKAQYFITCNELSMQTINEVKPEFLRKILTEPKKKKDDDRQLSIIFPD
jgi:predicted DNA-binding helix-hairpin-helix protein